MNLKKFCALTLAMTTMLTLISPVKANAGSLSAHKCTGCSLGNGTTVVNDTSVDGAVSGGIFSNYNLDMNLSGLCSSSIICDTISYSGSVSINGAKVTISKSGPSVSGNVTNGSSFGADYNSVSEVTWWESFSVDAIVAFSASFSVNASYEYYNNGKPKTIHHAISDSRIIW